MIVTRNIFKQKQTLSLKEGTMKNLSKTITGVFLFFNLGLVNYAQAHEDAEIKATLAESNFG